MRKNLLLTFCFSFIPGAGQMYQTYKKRGLSIMIIAALLFMISIIFDTFIFAIPFVIVMAFSFFDTFDLRNMNDEKRKEYVDEYIWNTNDFKELVPIKMNIKANKSAGILLIVLGIYALLLKIFESLSDFCMNNNIITTAYHFIRSEMPLFIVAVACIYIGIKIVKNKD